MIVVKLKLVNGSTDIFVTDKFLVSSIKEMHPDILDAKVFAGNKLISHTHRKFHWFYKKFLYKPLPQEPVEEPVAEKPKKTATKKTSQKKK